jgi:hypothetical protein
MLSNGYWKNDILGDKQARFVRLIAHFQLEPKVKNT